MGKVDNVAAGLSTMTWRHELHLVRPCSTPTGKVSPSIRWPTEGLRHAATHTHDMDSHPEGKGRTPRPGPGC